MTPTPRRLETSNTPWLPGATGDRGSRTAHRLLAPPPRASRDRRPTLAPQIAPQQRTSDPLEDLLEDPEVSEVMVNAQGRIWVERGGGLEMEGTITSDRLDGFVERLLTTTGRRLDRCSPIVDARLPDGSRVCVVIPPVSVDGVCLSIRRFAVRPITLSDMAPPHAAACLERLVASRANIVVSGPTSSGKTTLLNALTGVIDPRERLICIEDIAELRPISDHVVRLETRTAHPDGPEAVDLGDLVRAALRLRPDRLVVGEVRGAEALDVLHALNTGHDGSLSTVHANSPADALLRLAVLAASSGIVTRDTAGDLAVGAIDAVVHVDRGRDGQRRVDRIVEPDPHDHRSPPRVLVAHDIVMNEPLRPRARR